MTVAVVVWVAVVYNFVSARLVVAMELAAVLPVSRIHAHMLYVYQVFHRALSSDNTLMN